MMISISAIAGLIILGVIISIFQNVNTASQRVQIRKDDPFAGTPVFTLSSSIFPAYNAVFSPDSKQIIVFNQMDQGSELTYFDVTTGKVSGTIKTVLGSIDKIAFRSDGKKLAVAAPLYADLNLIDPANPEPISVIKYPSYNFYLGPSYLMVQFTVPSNQLKLLTQNGDLESRSGDTGELVETQKSKICTTSALSPDGTTLSCAMQGNNVELIGAKTGSLVFDGSRISAMKFSPDGNTLAVNGPDRLTVWHLDTGEQIPVSDYPGVNNVSSFQFSSNGELLIIGGTTTLPKEHGVLASVDVKLGKTKILYTDLSATNPVVSPDFKWIALRKKGGVFFLYDLSAVLK
jgi:WD40 repeat protein